MVKYTISIQADMEGVHSMRLKDNVDLCISVRNPLQAEETREKVVLEGTHEAINPAVGRHEKHRNEHPYHLALKWQYANDTNTRATARIIKTHAIEIDNSSVSPQFVPLVELDCDGLEPFAFFPLGNEFVVVDKAGKEHTNVDVSGGDWTTYDIGTGSTSILNFQSKIE